MQQHFVPEFLLNNFTASDGFLHFARVDWPLASVKKLKPEKLLRQGHLYTLTDESGNRDISLEEAYYDLESASRPVFQKIIEQVRQQQPIALSPAERGIVNSFFYHQWRRVPDVHNAEYEYKGTDDLIQYIDSEFEKQGIVLSDEDREYLSDKNNAKRVLQAGKVRGLGTEYKEIPRILASKRLSVFTVEKPNTAFIISSNPVVKIGNAKLEHKDCELWLPISSDVALLLSHSSSKRAKLFKQEGVRGLNRYMVRASTVVAGRSEALIRSLRNPR